ncbi:CARDB domain-containing protein [Phycicoccus sp. CSK15P-2]|uniref:CARDB domain-containing protein n=1 Tax=Phycicoccus sp. CSK15P-2 TaxID=2807627 RepID=UPI0027DD9084|nr:CARDB domain-containing protein [Phycicoccus sp. CSK15P-2]
MTALLVTSGVSFGAAASAAPVDLAAGRATGESSHADVYPSSNITDGDRATYWESANRSFPQWVQVDLGRSATVQSLRLQLPAGWEARSQTIAVSAGAGGSALSTVKAAADYTFAPVSGNTVEIDVPDLDARVVRLTFTANTVWPAGQLSELQVLGTEDASPTPSPTPSGGSVVELARGKSISASSTQQTYVAAHANDGNRTTYWEGAAGQYPSTLTVALGAPASLDRLTIALNPDQAWSPRAQTLSVLGRTSGSTELRTLTAGDTYSFDPSTGNTVTIPVSGADISEVRLRFTANTGAGNGQVAELEVWGTPAPTPDLTVSSVTSSPESPTESSELTLSATVENVGTAGSSPSSVRFSVDDADVDTTAVPALEPGGSATVSVSAPAQPAGSHTVTAMVDPDEEEAELDESNNTGSAPVAVAETPSADLVPVLTFSPQAPRAGQTVTFSVAVRNVGSRATSSDPHAVTVRIAGGSGSDRTLTGSVAGAIAPGATSPAVDVGSWRAADGSWSVTTTVADDDNEIAARRGNNTGTTPLLVGRGASVPWTELEAEDGTAGGGATVVGPNRTVGDLAGEASGRRAVVLDATGEYVEWTTPVATNTLVARFAMPDAPGGGGIDSSINLYVDGRFVRSIPLTSRYAWVYGNETNPGNTPVENQQRHIYDEANVLLDSTVPAGARIRLQKDQANSAAYYSLDFVDLEEVAPVANPDPTRYVEPRGRDQQAIQAAIDTVIQDPGKAGVYLPAGTYTMGNKAQVYGRAMTITGAGPWYTRITAAPGSSNTDIGFNGQSGASGSTFSQMGFFGNYVQRIDGPGKAFDLTNVSDMTISDVWVEHMVCMFWASNIDDSTVTDSRIRNTWADGINMTNGSSGNTIRNIEARTTGDDSFAMFAATDNGGSGQSGNVFENLTSRLTWRAAGLAVYGGSDNTVRNMRIADTLVYSGVTISSLDFGIPMEGFSGTTIFDGITIERSGGHFWGSQTFPGMWLFSAQKTFTGIRVRNVDIVDPTYSGIMFQTNYSGGSAQQPIRDTTFENVTITGAHKSGDAFDAKSGFGIWANEMPEQGQGPAVGSATFTNLELSDNAQDIRNTTSTFTITVN